jgi:hypothetical protein
MRYGILSALVGCSLIAAAGCAPVEVLPDEHRSDHFAATAAHLDLGGTMFLYTDISGDVDKLAAFLAEIVAEIAAEEPQSGLGDVDVAALVGHLGLNGVQAVGLSSFQDGAIFHNKGIVYHPGEKQGLLRLLGDAPREFEIPDWAPADADLVFEQDYRLEDAFQVVVAIMREVMGSEADRALAELEQPIDNMTVSPRAIIDQLDTRVVGLIRMHPDRMLQVPGEDFSFPHTEFLLGVDHMGFVFDDVIESFGGTPMVKVESGERFASIRSSQPMPGALSAYDPVLAKDTQTGRVYLASSPALIDEITAAEKPLGKTAAFARATRGLPQRGNGLTFMAAGFLTEITDWLGRLAERDDELAFMVDVIEAMLPAADVPMASCTAAVADGLYFASNATTSHKSTLLVLAYANPVMMGMLGAMSWMMVGARAPVAPVAVEPAPAPMQATPAAPADPPPAPEKPAAAPEGQQ